MSDHDDELEGVANDEREAADEYRGNEPPPVCAVCHQEIMDSYYILKEKTFCPDCRVDADTYAVQGSGTVRFLRALAFGTIAAVGGLLIHYVLLKFAHIQVALVSVLIGLMVGRSVRNGSNGRGGWLYQALALFLTYSAIAVSFSAAIIPEFVARMEKKPVPARARVAQGGAGANLPQDQMRPGAQARPVPPKPLALGAIVLLFVQFLALGLFLVYGMPIHVGLAHPLTLLFIAFGLWEAWKVNTWVPLAFTGPYEVAPAPEDDPPTELCPSEA
ncbi:MAG: hypothetical protein P4L84_33160 [Isosphaeraceae bacterium]|nr:hypothetical protein [Isosphaeraceae bacterium]